MAATSFAAQMRQHRNAQKGTGHDPGSHATPTPVSGAVSARGASTGTTGAGIPPGYVVVEQRYVDELKERVETLQAEMRGVREDRQRLAVALQTLDKLAPAIERLAQADPSTAAALEATVGPVPRAPSIMSPDRPIGMGDGEAIATGVGEDAARGPAPPRTVSDVRIWTGTWNVGAKDPFAGMDVDKNLDVVERVLAPFVPRDYDIYVLGVQEAVSDSLYRAVSRFTGCYQLPLHAKLEPAKESGDGSSTRSRRMGRAVCVQEFIDDARKGKFPMRAPSKTDMLDRVWGRGDGAIMRQKFTGIAVFVTPSAAPYVRLLGVYKHSFGASEGSKGGVGVALGIYDSTMAFVTAHMASKRIDMRRQQYCDLVERLGAKLGGRGFQLTEEFHHVVWMGDLNYHCSKITAEEAAAKLRTGQVADLLLEHDELIQDRAQGVAFYDFEEPNMVPDFFPTYKRHTNRGHLDLETDPDWVKKMYVLSFKEPMYKGGRTVERVPSWADRIMFRTLPSRSDDLLPESLDPENPDAPHNYRAVNHGCDISDHCPVFCTWTLRIRLDPVDETLPEGLSEHDEGVPACVIGRGTLGVSPHLLHPALRPLNVILAVSNIKVNYRPAMRSPRALSILFPLPYEDGDDIPERAKIVRTGTMMSLSSRSDSREGLSGSVSVLLSRANKLPDLHILLKVSLEDATKAQAVISLRECGITDVGRMTVTRFAPLMRNGLRAVVGGTTAGPIDMEFTLEYHGHYVSDEQVAAAGMGFSSSSSASGIAAATAASSRAGGAAAASSYSAAPAAASSSSSWSPSQAGVFASPSVPRSVAAERLRQISSAMLAPTPHHQHQHQQQHSNPPPFASPSPSGYAMGSTTDPAAYHGATFGSRLDAAAGVGGSGGGHGPGPTGAAGGEHLYAPAPAAHYYAPSPASSHAGIGGDADESLGGEAASVTASEVGRMMQAGGGSLYTQHTAHPHHPSSAVEHTRAHAPGVVRTAAPAQPASHGTPAAMYGQMRVPAPAPAMAAVGDDDDDTDVEVDSD